MCAQTFITFRTVKKLKTNRISVSLFTANHNVPLCKSKSLATAAAFGKKTVSICVVGLRFWKWFFFCMYVNNRYVFKNMSLVSGSNLESLSKGGQYIQINARVCVSVFVHVCVCVGREKRDSVHKYFSSAPLTIWERCSKCVNAHTWFIRLIYNILLALSVPFPIISLPTSLSSRALIFILTPPRRRGLLLHLWRFWRTNVWDFYKNRFHEELVNADRISPCPSFSLHITDGIDLCACRMHSGLFWC